MSTPRFLDPDGGRYGIPSYPWGWGWVFDADLATRKQLSALGLCPGGHEPAAQLMWRSRRAGSRGGVRTALLYRISLAKPKRPMTPARERARRTCPTCGLVFNYCIPTSLGQCPNCEYGLTPETWELEAAA